MISFTVTGHPVGKQRPRVSMRGRRAMVYTPAETRVYETAVGFAARPHCPKVLEGPVALRVRAFVRRLGRAADLSNVVKSIEDGLNGVAWIDDRQVQRIRAELYQGLPERVEVEVWPLGEEAAG